MSTETPDTPQPLPLFYHDPQPVSSEQHARWSLRNGDFAFAAGAPFVPVVIGEFMQAMCSFPLVFASDHSAPLALLGLEQSNLFISDGVWETGKYIPAYVRRYPFGFIATARPNGFTLAIDAASQRVDPSGAEGSPLFEDGKPSALTRQALDFCYAFRGEAAATAQFIAALQSKQLLTDRRADATLPDGSKFGVTGFQVVDAEKFARLDAGTIVEWHNKGWLALVHFHLASLARFTDLLARQSALRAAAPAASATPAKPGKRKPAATQ